VGKAATLRGVPTSTVRLAPPVDVGTARAYVPVQRPRVFARAFAHPSV